uniref:Dirigent protein n=1 Tax=Leersia perrieri TaxID=77586 RepID=A0A0D9WUN0_9ORYZ
MAWMKQQAQSSSGHQQQQLPSIVVYLAAATVLIMLPWRQWLNDAVSDENVTHLHFFMHDVMTGPEATAFDVVNGTGKAFDVVGGLRFGQVVVMDDLLTAGVDPSSSPAVGRTQGFYVFSDMDVPALLFCMNVVLTAGPYAGSSLTILGRDHITEPLRELSVVGGTGEFRMAKGYVLWKTASWSFRENAVLELDVFVHTRRRRRQSPESSPSPLFQTMTTKTAASSSRST